MNSKISIAAIGLSLLVSCTPKQSTPDGTTILDEDVALERGPKIDAATREIDVDAGSILVAIADEQLTDVRIRLETLDPDKDSVKPVEVENHLEGAGVEVATIEIPKASRIKVTLWGPRDTTTAGRVHLRLRRFAAPADKSKFAAQAEGFVAWSAANNTNTNGSADEHAGVEGMTRAIDRLSSPQGDAALAAQARLIKIDMLVQFDGPEVFQARDEVQRAAEAFGALPTPDKLGIARARVLGARALSKIAMAPPEVELPLPREQVDKMARETLEELGGPDSPFGPTERARAVAEIGYMDVDRSAFEHAGAQFEAAKVLYERGGHVAGAVEMRGNLAEFIAVQGRRYEAAKAYDAVLPDLDRISNHDTRVAFLLFAARAQSYAGRTDEAVANLLKALAQAREYELHGQEGGALQALGQTYWARGDYYQARAFFEEASRLARTHHDLAGLAYTLQDAGKVARHDGDYEAAIRMHEESVKLAAGMTDPVARVRALHHLGLDYLFAGRHAEAISQLRGALAVKLGDPRHYAYCDAKRDLARALISQAKGSPADLREAQKLLAEAAKQAAEMHDAPGVIGAYAFTADLLAKQGKSAAARQEFERTFARIFEFRKSTSNPQLLTTTLGYEQPAFRGYFDLMLRGVVTGVPGPRQASKVEEDALRMLELARESHFGAVDSAPMDPTAAARVDALFSQMADKSLEIATLIGRDLTPKESTQLAALQLDMSNLRAEVDRERTEAAKAQAQNQKTAAPAARDWRVIAAGTVQLSYALGNEHAYVWARSAAGTRVAMLGESPEKIESALADLASLDAQRAPEKIEQALVRVSSILLPPGLLPADSTAVQVVAEGRIANVPFAGLRSPANPAQRLVETHAVTMITTMLAVADPPRPRAARPFRLVGLASGMGTLRSAVAPDPAPRLQAATSEIRSVADLFEARDKSAKVKLLTEAEGNAAAVRGIWSSGADVVHFATHALADLRQPLASLLVLPAKGADGKPTYLTAGQVQEWRGDADLVFLSACESAVGPPRFAGGMPGLQSAFLRAGARNVIATLWPIEDVLAHEFSIDFYRQFTGGKSAIESLRETQRAWLAPKAGASEAEQMRRGITALAHGVYAQ